MKDKLVSIIIPVYNAEKWIEETIYSALSQTYQNIELIVIDDGSTDNSFNIISSIKSEKIQLHKTKNKGACAARNYGFELSSGHFIQYLDSDDILAKNKIACQIACLQTSSNALASCGWTFFKDEYENLKTMPQYINKSYSNPIEWLIDAWSGKGMGQTSIWLTPRSLIEKTGKWNEKLLINQDGDFFSRIILNSTTIIYSPKTIIFYRMDNPSSISQSKRTYEKSKSQLDSYKLYEKHTFNYLEDINVRRAIGHIYLKFIYHQDRYYPKLSKTAWGYFYSLDVGKPWIVGGRKFKILAKVVGFITALRFIRMMNQRRLNFI